MSPTSTDAVKSNLSEAGSHLKSAATAAGEAIKGAAGAAGLAGAASWAMLVSPASASN